MSLLSETPTIRSLAVSCTLNRKHADAEQFTLNETIAMTPLPPLVLGTYLAVLKGEVQIIFGFKTHG